MLYTLTPDRPFVADAAVVKSGVEARLCRISIGERPIKYFMFSRLNLLHDFQSDRARLSSFAERVRMKRFVSIRLSMQKRCMNIIFLSTNQLFHELFIYGRNNCAKFKESNYNIECDKYI